MRVFVYRNLRKKCYSIKALEGPNKGKVIAHAKLLRLLDVTFKVSAKGRERVRRTGHKTVHAGLVGQWDGVVDTWGLPDDCGARVYYNPHKVDTFVDFLGRPMERAGSAFLGLTGVFAERDTDSTFSLAGG